MSEQFREIECNQKWLVLSAGLLIGFPLLFSLYFFWRVHVDLAIETKVFFVALFSVVWFPAAFWLGPDYVSSFRFDRVGAHRAGVPLRGGTIRWSEMDKIRIARGARADAVFIHGGGRRFVVTSRTHENVEEAMDLLRAEAGRRGITLE